jgi:hypothetical protein
MFGDGASNTGNFGETMNLAALWSLPVVFLVENNLYGMGTSIERHSAVTDLSHKAEGLGVPGERVDGMDVTAMRECVADHLRMAREERKPTLVEAFTYRYRGHSAADPEVYREKEEVEEWRQKDPIDSFAKRLIEAGIIDEGHMDELQAKVDARVKEAVEFADASPEPPLDSLYDNLYVVDGEGWYSVDERTPEPFRGEREREAADSDRVRELHEAGAAYGGQSPRSGGGSGEGPADSEGDEGRPTDEAQAEEEGEVDATSAEAEAGDGKETEPGGDED